VVTSVEVQRRDITRGFFGFREILNIDNFLQNFNYIAALVKNRKTELQNHSDLSVLFLTRDELLELLRNINAANSDKPDFHSFYELIAENFFPNVKYILAIDESMNSISQIDPVQSLKSLNADQTSFYRRSILQVDVTSLPVWGERSEEFAGVRIKAVIGVPERKIPDLYPDDLVVHARIYQLFKDAEARTGFIGWGLSIIGWVPAQTDQIWIHEGAARDE
jgi:hypothetical protein